MANRMSLQRSTGLTSVRLGAGTFYQVDSSDPLQALRTLPMWGDLPLEALERIASQSTLQHVRKNQEICSPDGGSALSCFLVEGHAKLEMESGDGRKKVVEIVGPGYSCDECFSPSFRRPAMRVITLGAARVLWIARKALDAEMQVHPSLAMRFISNLSERLGELLQDLDSHSFDTAMQRFVRYVVGRLLPRGAESWGEPVAVTLPAGKAVVASRLSLSPEYFSRMLRQLETEQLIAVDNRTILIHDVQRLLAMHGPNRI